jgi:hypothetical protein
MAVKRSCFFFLGIVDTMPIPQTDRKRLLKQIDMAEQYQKLGTSVIALTMRIASLIVPYLVSLIPNVFNIIRTVIIHIRRSVLTVST